MRIIFLNTWQCNVWNKLQSFVLKQSKLTDIFCFQEVSPSNFSKFQKILTGFDGYRVGGDRPKYNGLWYGQATFVKKSIKVLTSDKVVIFRKYKNILGFMLSEKLAVNRENFWIGNIHGVSFPGHKLDTEIRLKQSQIIIDFLKDKTPVIFGGDFNLLPDAKSVKMFEEEGYRDLIKGFKVKSTRNKMSWNFYSKRTNSFVKQYFADYVFVSPEVKVKSFEVPNIEVSDHLPLILDFEV